MSMITLTLQSCCSMFEIFPLSPELIVAYVGHTTEEEKVYISEDGLKAPVILSNGDMWRSLNVLQSTKMALGREIKQTNVYGTLLQIWFCQHSGPDVDQGLTTASTNSMELKTLKRLALYETLFLCVELTFHHRFKYILLTKMADIEYRLSVDTNEKKIQLSSFIAAFKSPETWLLQGLRLLDTIHRTLQYLRTKDMVMWLNYNHPKYWETEFQAWVGRIF